jgi:hypothetical protein
LSSSTKLGGSTKPDRPAKPGERNLLILKKFLRAYRKYRLWLVPLAGAVIGLAGGAAGAAAGLVLGLLLREVFDRFNADRAALDYLENPGPSDFYEGEPGLAAYCALSIIVLSLSLSKKNRRGGNSLPLTEAASRDAVLSFPGEPVFVELFCRLAASCRRRLNPDLLAESLASRRRNSGDLPALGKALGALAEGDEAKDTARRIRRILDPGYEAHETDAPDSRNNHPWEILGLAEGASQEEVKSVYRRLAIQFHPDSLAGLSENQKMEAERVFIRIKEAYREITGVEKGANPQ